jgi:acetyl esterase/lipase
MMSRPAPAIPDELRALMARVGPQWASDIPGNVRLMIRSFDPVLANAPKEGITVVRDVAYGDHPRQTLDVFASGSDGPSPVAIFVHGGAFVDGEKNRSAEVYSNVLFYLARHGVVGINMEYRLAPESPYPAGIEDVASVVAWVRANAAEHGGDPRRIFLIGHSSGAAHAAGYAYGTAPPAEGASRVAGLIVISGRVRADARPDNPNARKVQAYYGTNADLYERLSPVTMVDASSVPTMIAFAEYENPLIDVYCLELAYRLAQAKGRAPPVLRLAGHNHTSIIAHINTAEERLGREMLEFIRHA